MINRSLMEPEISVAPMAGAAPRHASRAVRSDFLPLLRAVSAHHQQAAWFAPVVVGTGDSFVFIAEGRVQRCGESRHNLSMSAAEPSRFAAISICSPTDGKHAEAVDPIGAPGFRAARAGLVSVGAGVMFAHRPGPFLLCLVAAKRGGFHRLVERILAHAVAGIVHEVVGDFIEGCAHHAFAGVGLIPSLDFAVGGPIEDQGVVCLVPLGRIEAVDGQGIRIVPAPFVVAGLLAEVFEDRKINCDGDSSLLGVMAQIMPNGPDRVRGAVRTFVTPGARSPARQGWRAAARRGADALAHGDAPGTSHRRNADK